MKSFLQRAFFLLALVCFSTFLHAAEPAAKPRYLDPAMPRFRIAADGFDSDPDDIKNLLTSAGRELWRFFPDYKVEPFVVTRGKEGPIVLHRRKEGEIVMRLDTSGTLWAQYSYQFSHEFCHILCKYEDDYQGNQFFEEALCECASLFVLRQMAEEWKTDPPYKNWRDFAPHLREYADDRMKFEPVFEPRDFAGYVRANQAELLKNAKHGEFHRSVAIALLKKFEAEPSHWESIRWINSAPAEDGETISAYFTKWHAAAPERHQAFVADVAKLFDVEIK